MDTLIDKVYYINLDTRPDRREQIEDVLKSLEIPTHKIKRVSGIVDKRHGAIGCTKSHISCIEDFIKSGKEIALILEDDFVYSDKQECIESIRYFFSLSIPFDMVSLTKDDTSKATAWKGIHRVANIRTTAAYIVHRGFAQKLLENMKEGLCGLEGSYFEGKRTINSMYCIDTHWKKLQTKNSRWYCFSKPIGLQRESYSDILGKVVFYGI